MKINKIGMDLGNYGIDAIADYKYLKKESTG